MSAKGLVHIYTGDGKGKTTCAVGLAARAAGYGHKVVFTQFLKTEDSGERASLRLLPTLVLTPNPTKVCFIWEMTEEERAREAARCRETFARACALAEDARMLILDEALVAAHEGFLSEDALLAYLDAKPEGLEIVLTGRGASERMRARADYVSVIGCEKHPYTRGIGAREGVEY